MATAIRKTGKLRVQKNRWGKRSKDPSARRRHIEAGRAEDHTPSEDMIGWFTMANTASCLSDEG
jgi:hypothetical protein